MARLTTEPTSEGRFAAFEDLQRLWYQDAPAIKLVNNYGIAALSARVKNVLETTHFEIEPGTIDPRLVVRAVDDLVPGDIGLFISNGASSSITTMNSWKARPYVHTSGFFGCIGQMLPTAMGAMLANGNWLGVSSRDRPARRRMPRLTAAPPGCRTRRARQPRSRSRGLRTARRKTPRQ